VGTEWRNVAQSRWRAFGDEWDTSRGHARFRGLGHVAAVGHDDEDVQGDAQSCQAKRGARRLFEQTIAHAHRQETNQAGYPDPRPKGHCPGLLIDGRVVQDELDHDRPDGQRPPLDADPLQAGG